MLRARYVSGVILIVVGAACTSSSPPSGSPDGGAGVVPFTCEGETSLSIEPIWIAGAGGPRAALGAFGKPDAIFLDDTGILLAGDEDAAYEEVHLFDTNSDDPNASADALTALADWGAEVGPGGDEPLEFRGISGFAKDREAGRLYIVEQGNGRIQVLEEAEDPSLAPYYTFAEFRGAFAEDLDNPEDGTFVRPQAARVDALGRLFVSDDARDHDENARRDIQVFDREGEFLFKFGDSRYGEVGQDGRLMEPENFVIDPGRNRIYVCDEGPANVVIYDYDDQEFERRFGGFTGVPNGIDIDQYGYIYVVDEGTTDGSWVRVFDPDTLTEVFRFGGFSEEDDLTPGRFNSPDSLLVDVAQDVIIVADQGHKRVQGFRLSEVQARSCLRSLRVSGPARAVVGKTLTLRVELLGPFHEADWASYRQTVTVLDGDEEITTEEINSGAGSVTFEIEGSGPRTFTLSVAGLTAEHEVDVIDDDPDRTLSGALSSEELTWSGDELVFIEDDIVIPEGDTLSIEAGALVMIAPEARIEVGGSVVAEGTEVAPIAFFSSDPEDGWGQIDHLETSETASYRNVFFTNGANAYWERNFDLLHCCAYMLRVRNADLNLTRAVIADSTGKGVLTFYSDVHINGTLFNRLGFGAELTRGTATVEDSWFAEMRGVDDNDCLYLSATEDEDIVEFHLRRVVLADTDDDGLDTENSSPIAVDLIAYGNEDKALSLTGGSPSFTNCLLFDAGNGVKIDDKFQTAPAIPTFENCTIVENEEGGFWASDRGGADAAADIRPVFRESVIWNNPATITTAWSDDLITVEWCNVEHPSADWQGEGVISEEPLFLPDYRLHPLSPGYDLSGADGPIGFQGFPREANPSSEGYGLVINEVAAAGAPNDWFELYNSGSEDVPLAGFFFTDALAEPQRAQFASNAIVPAGGYLLVELDNDQDAGFQLASSEELAVLDPDGRLVAYLSWTEGRSPAGASFGRMPDGTGDFKTLLNPTPDAANVDNEGGFLCDNGIVEGEELCDDGNRYEGDGCTGCRVDAGWECEGTAPTVCETRCGDGVRAGHEQCDDENTIAGDGCNEECNFEDRVVVINEVRARSSDPDAVELYNVGETVIDLEGWSITDDQPDAHRFTFGESAEIEPGEYLVIVRNDDDELTFGLGSNDAVFLFDPDGSTADVADWLEGDVPENSSWGRLPDGVGEFQTLSMATIGSENSD